MAAVISNSAVIVSDTADGADKNVLVTRKGVVTDSGQDYSRVYSLAPIVGSDHLTDSVTLADATVLTWAQVQEALEKFGTLWDV